MILSPEERVAKAYMMTFCRFNGMNFLNVLTAYRKHHPYLTLGQALIYLYTFFKISQ